MLQIQEPIIMLIIEIEEYKQKSQNTICKKY